MTQPIHTPEQPFNFITEIIGIGRFRGVSTYPDNLGTIYIRCRHINVHTVIKEEEVTFVLRDDGVFYDNRPNGAPMQVDPLLFERQLNTHIGYLESKAKQAKNIADKILQYKK